MPKCSRCPETNPNNFYADRSKPSGYFYLCKSCTKKQGYKWQRSYADEIDAIKSSVGCRCCGESTAVCLDFHHMDGNKVGEVSQMARRGKTTKQALQDEIAKCIVLCSNCHRKYHAGLLCLLTTYAHSRWPGWSDQQDEHGG